MHYSKIKEKKIFKIGFIILILFMIVFTGYSLKYDRKLTFIEKTIKGSIGNVINVLSSPFKYLGERYQIFIKADEIYDEYNKLKKNKEDYTNLDNRLNQLENENEELREMLGIKESILNYEEIGSTVIYRNTDYWMDKLEINVGAKDGVQNDMAVVTSKGLIGYISNAGINTSTVTLLTNHNLINKISVKIEVNEGEYIYGLLSSYDEKSNVYIVDGLSEYSDIPINANVLTTGFTEKFPAGIKVGTVKSVNTDNYDLTKLVLVSPSVNMDDITYINVLKREADNK